VADGYVGKEEVSGGRVNGDEDGLRGEKRRDCEGPAEEGRYIMLGGDREVVASVVLGSSSSTGVIREVKTRDSRGGISLISN